MTVLCSKTFVFETIDAYSREVFDGHMILDWMDTEVKKSAFIDIEIMSLLCDENGRIHIVYVVVEIGKINYQYRNRHIALQDWNKN